MARRSLYKTPTSTSILVFDLLVYFFSLLELTLTSVETQTLLLGKNVIFYRRKIYDPNGLWLNKLDRGTLI